MNAPRSTNNYSSFQNKLSPFGQKVLQVLLQQWHTERVNRPPTIAVRQANTKEKRIISFRDSSSYADDNLNSHMKEARNVSDVVEAPKQFKACGGIQIQEICSKRVPDEDPVVTSVYDPSLIPDIQAQSQPQLPATTTDVTWSDMFDCELFPSDTLTKNLLIPDKKVHASAENESTTNNTEEIDLSPECDANHKTIKRKNATKSTHPEKRTKQKTDEAKNSFRKEKYTKTVKKWLKDIGSNSPERIVESEKKDTDKVVENELNRKPRVQNKMKKIQTQLANIEGIMKFEKPDDISEQCLQVPNDTGESSNVLSNEAPKDKKTLKKFVAPVKSEIPMKDVTYDIYELSDDNIDEHITLLNDEDHPALSIVLVFSNGLCQLSKDYTEDSENIPEGIMICKNVAFFYVKKFEPRTKVLIFDTLKKSKMICYDGKNILIFLLQYFEMRPFSLFDAKIGAALLDPDNIPHDFLSVQKLVSCTPQFTILSNCPLQKTARYTVLLQECASKLKTSLTKNFLWKVFDEIEMKLVPIIAAAITPVAMEAHGVRVESARVARMEREVRRRLEAAERACAASAAAAAAADRPFQPSSPAQVRALLYDTLRLDRRARLRVAETAATGAKSTSEAALRGLVGLHPLPALILQHRHLHKAHATFLAGIASHIHDGVVRPKWVQIAAATGRIGCNSPNLQAIPKMPFQLTLFPESEDKAEEPLSLRSAYVSGGSSRALLAADFRQVECRVWAHAAADARLASAIASHDDVFCALAAQWLKKPESEVQAAERERTKRVVYGLLYGAGARALAQALAVPYHQALDIASSFQAAFPSLRRFAARVEAQCAADGGRVRSLGGRARRLPALADDAPPTSPSHRARAARQAVNYVVQGSAADVCKLAMIATDERLRALGLSASLVLQLHDELVWDVDREQLDRVAGVVKEAMEQCGRWCGLPPLPVALSAGASWADLKPWPLTPSPRPGAD